MLSHLSKLHSCISAFSGTIFSWVLAATKLLLSLPSGHRSHVTSLERLVLTTHLKYQLLSIYLLSLILLCFSPNIEVLIYFFIVSLS